MLSDAGSAWDSASTRSGSKASLSRFGLRCPQELRGVQLGPAAGMVRLGPQRSN